MSESAGPRPVTGVAVLTVSYGSSTVIRAFLESVRPQLGEGSLVMVADNKPDPAEGLQAMVESFGATYRAMDANRGYGGALNALVRELPERITHVVLANPDVVVMPGALDLLMTSLDAAPEIGAVGPAILDDQGAVYPSARRVPTLGVGAGHALLGRAWPGNPWTRAYREERDVVARDCGWLSGAFVLVRRSAFDEIGGFDERYFMYFEDVDLGYRLGRAGYRNRYEPAAVIRHLGAHSTTSHADAMVRQHHESARLFLTRRYPRWWMAPVRWAVTAGLAVRSWWSTRRR